MTGEPNYPTHETAGDALGAAADDQHPTRRGGRVRFSNKEWIVLLAALVVAIGGTTAAALSPGRAAASATPSTASATPIPDHACPTTTTVAASIAATVPTILASAATTGSAVATPVATVTTTTTVARKNTSRTTSGSTSTKKFTAKASTPSPVEPVPSLVSVGTLIRFGTYDGAPLRWRVVDADDSGFVLVSEYVLSAGAFESNWEGRNASRYTGSEVQSWLKGDFAEKAFDTTQSAALLPHVGGAASGDRVFLLSAAEVKRYLPKTASRKAAPGISAGTSHTGFSGEALALTGPYAAWWLADAGGDNFSAQVVEANGKLGNRLVYYADLGVRPAIRVSRDKIAFTLQAQGE